MLQRMNELATQAANGTNSKDSDRQAIQDELDQLTTEIDRVSETTKFNETYLLKGEAGTKTINMKAHDAGLKGTLTDNGDGTATFVMDSLKDGDSVSIGGKTYKIGSTEQAAKNLIAKSATGTVDVEIGDQKFKIKSDGEVQNANGDKLYIKTADGSATVATTFTSYTIDSQFTNDKGAKVANTALSVTNLKSLVKGGVTVKVGNDTAIAMTDTAGGAADGVHGKLLLDDFSLCPYSLKIINYFHLITILTERNSLIIFYEVQMFPQARAAIKYLVGEVDSVRSDGCGKIKRFS